MKISMLTGMVLLLCTIGVSAQTLSPDLISSSGDHYTYGGGSLSWSLGEGITETVQNQNVIMNQGFQQSWNAPFVVSQVINIPSGWSMFSTYIDPGVDSIPVVLSQIVNDVVIVKNGLGLIYWPIYGVNTIGEIIKGEGYQINAAQATVLEIFGSQITPEITPLIMPQGWSLIGYLRQTPADVELMTSPILSSIKIVKNEMGQVYWPQYSLNLIGDMLPGKGYQINLFNPETLVYPANAALVKTSGLQIAETRFYRPIKYTSNNMTVGLPVTAFDVLPEIGDELAIYNQQGIMVGAAVFNGSMMAIPIWGADDWSNKDDYLNSDEAFVVKHYHYLSGKEELLAIESWDVGDGLYGINEIAIAGNIKHTNIFSSITEMLTCRNYPNPFKDQTVIEFYLPETADVKVEVLNMLGMVTDVLASREFSSGTNKLIFRTAKYNSGTFLYRVSTKSATVTNYMTIVK